ncbi:hypothetical protein GIB67_003013 [Kingdonia uniflora]|uniref:C2H2-type domain-containing protein n=1 Tax=Kingdonia uniflora TaxID=39325 RepID=A0A7J7LYM4_9MAGN|nr:hypothetical protein GIB67_003013 [Kingdonia uniflora]
MAAETKVKRNLTNKNSPKLQNPEKKIHLERTPQPQQPSWSVMRSLFTCKYHQTEQKQFPIEVNSKKCKKMRCSGSLCSNTRVMHRPETTSSSSPVDNKKWGSIVSTRSMKGPLSEVNEAKPIKSVSVPGTTRALVGGSFRGMQLRRLSGCYECRMVVDPSHGVSSIRATLCSCSECGEIFMKPENLELHKSVRHAVSELGPEDSSKNIVEIIFKSSWLKKQAPICKIDRILKVHNSQKTVTRFEDYRTTIKSKANKLGKKHPRCVADGNELLRFHCTTFICSIGVNRSSNLCNLIPQCHGCSIIRNGFKCNSTMGESISTTATSGKAHDNGPTTPEDHHRAMLVCRVIAGRVKRTHDTSLDSLEEFDSIAGPSEVYSDLDELFVSNPKAILPCFVVIYKGF